MGRQQANFIVDPNSREILNFTKWTTDWWITECLYVYVDSMLVHRPWRWPNIEPTSVERLVFSECCGLSDGGVVRMSCLVTSQTSSIAHIDLLAHDTSVETPKVKGPNTTSFSPGSRSRWTRCYKVKCRINPIVKLQHCNHLMLAHQC